MKWHATKLWTTKLSSESKMMFSYGSADPPRRITLGNWGLDVPTSLPYVYLGWRNWPLKPRSASKAISRHAQIGRAPHYWISVENKMVLKNIYCWLPEAVSLIYIYTKIFYLFFFFFLIRAYLSYSTVNLQMLIEAYFKLHQEALTVLVSRKILKIPH